MLNQNIVTVILIILVGAIIFMVGWSIKFLRRLIKNGSTRNK